MPSTFNPKDLSTYKGKRVLLLQGPVGPFFARLAVDLRKAGATVNKVNFHAGDWLFYRRDALWFRGKKQEWPAFLSHLLAHERIDTILLYGDCRPAHLVALHLARERGLHIGVFEEGYLRPNHITLETWGVNGNSRLPRDPQTYLDMPELPDVEERGLGNTYWHMIWWGFWYFTVGALGRLIHADLLHHRSLSIGEAWPWLRSAWRKHWYRWTEHAAMPTLLAQWKGRYFLVPLQVHNDSQLTMHSRFDSIERFITEVMGSFAKSASIRTALVFKHHPMDRGYCNYRRLIGDLALKHDLAGRVFYIHDQHLPTLLDKARGVVVINSTVGLQALRHGTAVKALGDAIYNMQGLTHQGSLDSFWRQAPTARPNPRLLRQFVRYLKHENQINGNYYSCSLSMESATGLDWGPATHHEAFGEATMVMARVAPSHRPALPSTDALIILATRPQNRMSANDPMGDDIAAIQTTDFSAAGRRPGAQQTTTGLAMPRAVNSDLAIEVESA